MHLVPLSKHSISPSYCSAADGSSLMQAEILRRSVGEGGPYIEASDAEGLVEQDAASLRRASPSNVSAGRFSFEAFLFNYLTRLA